MYIIPDFERSADIVVLPSAIIDQIDEGTTAPAELMTCWTFSRALRRLVVIENIFTPPNGYEASDRKIR